MSELEDWMEGDQVSEEFDLFHEYEAVDDTFSGGEEKHQIEVKSDLALLPAQIEFMNDITSRSVAYVGGFGSGV